MAVYQGALYNNFIAARGTLAPLNVGTALTVGGGFFTTSGNVGTLVANSPVSIVSKNLTGIKPPVPSQFLSDIVYDQLSASGVYVGIPEAGVSILNVVRTLEALPVSSGQVALGLPALSLTSFGLVSAGLLFAEFQIGVPAVVDDVQTSLPLSPDEIKELETEFKTEVIEFENGAEQRFTSRRAGKKSYVFKWNLISPDERASLQNFFDDQLGRFRRWTHTDSRLGVVTPMYFRFDDDKMKFIPVKHKVYNLEIKVITATT